MRSTNRHTLVRGVLGGLLLAVVPVVAACGSRLEELSQLPESQLYYPNADVISSGGSEAYFAIDGGGPASFGFLLGSQDSADGIEAFYEEELLATGWTEEYGNLTIPSAGDTSVRGWRKDGVVFTFRARRMTGAFAPPADLVAKYKTVVSVRLIDDSECRYSREGPCAR